MGPFMVALLFPGQGSQSSGMGRALADASPAARAVFEEADEALGFGLSKLCFAGSEDELKRTEHTQPALLTVSVAAHRALEEAHGGAIPTGCLAGHSLGEWSALVVAGALAFADAVRLVRERGRLMQAAVPEGQGAMLAAIGLDADTVRTVTADVARAERAPVAPANFNAPEQTVVSGAASAMDALEVALTAAGASKVVRLPVSAPFHCPMMAPAAAGLEAALAPVTVSAPSAPVYSNVEATPNTRAERLKPLLVEQVTAPVRWTEIVRGIVGSGETLALELGPGKVLMGLTRRIDRSLKVIPVGDPAGVDKALAAL